MDYLKATTFNRPFLMVESADHLTALTGATVTVKIGKNGGTGAAAGGTVSEIDSTNLPGWYNVALTTTDTGTAGALNFHCTAASGDPTDFVDHVLDPTVAGYGVNLVNIAGSAVSTSTAQLGVNVVQVNGQTATAAAGVTFPASLASPTNITAGTITTVTNLTNAPTSGDLTSTMKTSVTTAATAATPAAASVTAAVAVTSNVKKNSAGRLTFVMTDSTTHNPKTGVTVTSQVSIDGGALASTANSASEISNGLYTLVLGTADTNGNALNFRLTATGADDLNIFEVTQP